MYLSRTDRKMGGNLIFMQMEHESVVVQIAYGIKSLRSSFVRPKGGSVPKYASLDSDSAQNPLQTESAVFFPLWVSYVPQQTFAS